MLFGEYFGSETRSLIVVTLIPLVFAPFAFFLPPGRMAANAILKITNAFFPVFTLDLGRGMLVAAVAGLGLQTVRVASLAGTIIVGAVVHRERMRATELGRSPGAGSMAIGAGRAKQARVRGRFGMAGDTIAPRPGEDIVEVTRLAGHLGVRPGQGEVGQSVVKGGRLPIGWRMAGGAILAKLALVGIVLLMAGVTAGWRGL
jgi:hypothetical protein